MFHLEADNLKQFCLVALTSGGVHTDVAQHVAAGLVQASLRGVDSHGVRLLPHYTRALKAGRLSPQPVCSFDRTST